MNGSTLVDDNFSLAASDVINATYFPATAGVSLFHRPIFDAIDLYVTPAWYVLGIPGNIMAFIVWVQRRMRPSSGYFLAALALDECFFLIMQVTYTLR
jgi:tryptophan-rich sensory protein